MGTVVVTGIAGSLARLAALEFLRRGHEVVGVDYRPRPRDFPPRLSFVQANYNKTRIEDIFRRHTPEVVLHLGRVGNLKVRANKRFDLNVVGSAKIQELCLKYATRRLVVLSTFHIYGAHAHNHIPIFESDPIRGFQTMPILSDSIQIDHQAVQWTFRHRRLKTIVLRPTNVIGAHIRNTVSGYLRREELVYASGFNPMWQFVHESDMLRALLLAAESDRVGVYNVAGPGSIPIVEALKLTGGRPRGVPSTLIRLRQRVDAKSYSHFPRYLLDFFKYPCIVSDDSFREHCGYEPRVSEPDAIRSCVSRMPLEATLG